MAPSCGPHSHTSLSSLLSFTEGDDHERVAETRDHRVRGWHGSDELSPGRARPRLIGPLISEDSNGDPTSVGRHFELGLVGVYCMQRQNTY